MSEDQTPIDRNHWPMTKGSLADLENGDEVDLSLTTTMGERMEMVWQLTKAAWAFRGEPIDESRLSRSPGRVIRRGS